MEYFFDLFIYDLIIVLITYLYVFATILIPVQLKKREKISKFQARKAVHLFAGLAAFSSPYYYWKWWAVIIASTLTVLVLFSSKKSKVKQLKELYESIGEEAEEKVGYLQGPFHYCLSILSLVTFFVIFAPNKLYYPIAGILLMIISDTLASIVGKRYGRIKINIPWLNSSRTLEGSLTFFISGYILCFIAFTIIGVMNPTQLNISFVDALILSLITSALAAIIEILSPSTWDDLTVPILTTLIIFLLSLL